MALLWLWCRPAAISLSGTLALEPPYAMGAALKRQKKKKKKNKNPTAAAWIAAEAQWVKGSGVATAAV